VLGALHTEEVTCNLQQFNVEMLEATDLAMLIGNAKQI